ncbi:MAG: acyl-CoA dehydrogenase family protein [Rhodospirillaceae bacterium]|nr:acyl-CoA dehydrogenase family protein [Rhodospirillaceae bacterium]
MKRTVYTEEHEIFRESVHRFLEQEAVPHYQSWEDEGLTPDAFWKKAGEQGLLCPQIPEEYGGPGGDYRYLAIVNEEMALMGLSAPNFPVHSDISAEYILKYGSEAQKKEWLPKMVSGAVRGAIAMTEPNTGSDLQAVRTTAIRDGNEYVLNGAKTFISNGYQGGIYIVVAKTDPSKGAKGISLILVPRGTKGFEPGRKLNKMGLKGQDTAELFFNDARVPISNLLGEEGKGFAYLMSELPQERLAIASSGVGFAQRAYDLALAYAKERKAFGKSILDFQNTRFKLAEVRTELEVGWAFLDKCISAHMEREFTVTEAAMAKLWTTELQGRVTDTCLQIFGGYGYMLEYEIAKLYADARVTRIYGGTSEIMKEIIGRSLDKEN